MAVAVVDLDFDCLPRTVDGLERYESALILLRLGGRPVGQALLPVVNGRIGRVKTEASNDYIPLDPTFAQILLTWKGESSTGLVFPSPVNRQCYNAGTIQQHILRPAFKKLGLPDKGPGCERFVCAIDR